MTDRLGKRSAEAYGRHAEAYASILERRLRPIAEEVIRLADVQSTERMLDLATGTGLIVRTVEATGASTVGSDISLGALRIAHRLSGGRIPFAAGDAHAMPFMDRCFSLVTCMLSLSHFSDVSTALAEIRRVLVVGGRFLAAAWGKEPMDPSYSAAVGLAGEVLEEQDDPSEGAFDEATWAEEERGCEVLRQAGFGQVQVTTLPLSGTYRSAADAVEWALAWPLTRTRMDRLGRLEQERLWSEAIALVKRENDLGWHREINYFQAARMGL